MIRLGTEEDINRVLELFKPEINLGGGIIDYDKKSILEYIKNNNCNLLVYELDNKIVGAATISFWNIANWVYVEEISVDEDYRKRGIATEILDYIENLANGKAIFLVVDETAEAMHNLMNKKSYRKEERKYIYYTK